jgi:hypothetical protein
MEDRTFNFNQKRDFNAIFSDAFYLIRTKYKDILKHFFVGYFPIIVAYSIFSLFINDGAMQNPNFEGEFDASFSIAALLNVVLAVFMFTFFISYTMHYFKSLAEDYNQPFNLGKIFGLGLKDTLSLAGVNIVNGFIVGIGFLLLIAPGFYLLIALWLLPFAYILGGKNLGDALGYAMDLIKGRWWHTAGIVIVTTILIYIILLLFTLPEFLLLGGLRLFDPGNPDFMEIDYLSTEVIISSVISSISYLAYYIYTFVYGLYYYSLVEEKEGVSLAEEIESL